MKSDFLKYQAQTTPHPLAMEISHAKGSYIFDTNQNKYLDFVAGVSASSLGHSHPKVIAAIKNQLDKYMHVMVYGEYVQQPAVDLSKLLAEILPDNLNKTYLVNSGTEAIDGAMKLARRFTGRTEILAAKNAYHGNSYGALSLMTHKDRTAPFQPMVGDIGHIRFNCWNDIQKISTKTAAVFLETIQGGAGFIEPLPGYLKKAKERCEEVGALLVLDEIQPGMGRTGTLFGFEHYGIIPDILVIGKGLAGGMPVGAFIASEDIMDSLSDNPKLGHITTFGGHPVIAAAGLATLQEITSSNLIEETIIKEQLIRKKLKHPLIKEIRGKGLMLALILESPEQVNQLILKCQDKGLILFWLLFEPKAVRISPPLTISNDEIIEGCQIILSTLDKL
ncbi:aspartate aminotransferase family protein [Spongiivirga citrea]|uniref:Aminotransferase class III-fold pyridoxal phosphate-dependent enzyme n=1 Tax=Spongiivirga citrea TaxID=1481457 RepID=A0A6M0CE46_9FLAO|nr:aspartate aminotransferase family protein [Spongiivirga citrea]NER16001.1 aminotransferase class III-fold pyridoxal phosphate-dependent enzyme [Spongiivirga citrea]